MIAASEVVPGDVLLLDAGDLVAADARLVGASALRANEAPLTGESQAVEKQTTVCAPDTPLADRVNMIFLGTSIVNGSGRALVVATGMNTEVGHIGILNHLWRVPFMLRLHPTGVACPELVEGLSTNGVNTARPERTLSVARAESKGKSKGARKRVPTHFI